MVVLLFSSILLAMDVLIKRFSKNLRCRVSTLFVNCSFFFIGLNLECKKNHCQYGKTSLAEISFCFWGQTKLLWNHGTKRTHTLVCGYLLGGRSISQDNEASKVHCVLILSRNTESLLLGMQIVLSFRN